MRFNVWHRRIAATSAIFLAVSAVTGILWAYAPHLYFKEGYLKKKSNPPELPLSSAEISVKDALKKAAAYFKTADGIQSATLRADAGRLFYEVQRRQEKDTHSALIDAKSGEVVSPVSEKLAVALAAQYVVGTPAAKKAEAFENYKHRNGKKFASVYIVTFAADGNPGILIDRNSGLILDEMDSSRNFHSWVMKLHQLQFFGTKKELTVIPGLSLLLLLLTGLVVGLRRYL